MRTFLVAFALLAAAPTLAHAGATDMQGWGTMEEWPSRFQIGFSPFGAQAGFVDRAPSGYKLALDFAGRIKTINKVSIWLGAAIGYTPGSFNCYGGQIGNQYVVGDCGNDVQFSAFAMVTFEKFWRFPLVPFVKGSLAADVMPRTNSTGSAVGVRMGAGVDYWLLRNVGFGIEENFTFGPGFLNGHTYFYGTADLLIGARFAL